MSKSTPQPLAADISTIEAEIQANLHQISQLHHRNAKLKSRLKAISSHRRTIDRSKSTSPRTSKTKTHKSTNYLQIIFIFSIVILFCGFLGFTLASKITGK